jgi:hypothetical protein
MEGPYPFPCLYDSVGTQDCHPSLKINTPCPPIGGWCGPRDLWSRPGPFQGAYVKKIGDASIKLDCPLVALEFFCTPICPPLTNTHATRSCSGGGRVSHNWSHAPFFQPFCTLPHMQRHEGQYLSSLGAEKCVGFVSTSCVQRAIDRAL